MGTRDPLVRIEAATLAGGDNNQDRYAYGDSWAFVLDGASSFSDTPPVHDGGWYAERLKNSLELRLEADGGAPTPTAKIVAAAIAEASEPHGGGELGPCPTSTIALARWSGKEIELYVLGDSFAMEKSSSICLQITDDRLGCIGSDLRDQYNKRLRNHSGFDREHRRLLQRLQVEQAVYRNKPGGYWIAGDNPRAAGYAHSVRLPLFSSAVVILATDGLSTQDRILALQGGVGSDTKLAQVLAAADDRETADPTGSHYPRSKVHDDKTVVRITWQSY